MRGGGGGVASPVKSARNNDENSKQRLLLRYVSSGNWDTRKCCRIGWPSKVGNLQPSLKSLIPSKEINQCDRSGDWRSRNQQHYLQTTSSPSTFNGDLTCIQKTRLQGDGSQTLYSSDGKPAYNPSRSREVILQDPARWRLSCKILQDRGYLVRILEEGGYLARILQDNHPKISVEKHKKK